MSGSSLVGMGLEQEYCNILPVNVACGHYAIPPYEEISGKFLTTGDIIIEQNKFKFCVCNFQKLALKSLHA